MGRMWKSPELWTGETLEYSQQSFTSDSGRSSEGQNASRKE